MECCEPLCCEPLGTESAVEMSTMLKALADPTRLRLFSLIASQGEQCACDFTDPLGVSQPTVSHHLKVLADAGLIERDQRGKWAYFRVNTDRLHQLSAFLQPVGVH